MTGYVLAAFDEVGAFLPAGFTDRYPTEQEVLEAGDRLERLTGAEVVATRLVDGEVVGWWG